LDVSTENDHPDMDLLNKLAVYLTPGALPESEVQAISEHIKLCVICKAIVELAGKKA